MNDAAKTQPRIAAQTRRQSHAARRLRTAYRYNKATFQAVQRAIEPSLFEIAESIVLNGETLTACAKRHGQPGYVVSERLRNPLDLAADYFDRERTKAHDNLRS